MIKNKRLKIAIIALLTATIIVCLSISSYFYVTNTLHEEDVKAAKVLRTHTKSYKTFMSYNKQLKNQKYITISQLKHLVVLHDNLIDDSQFSVKLFGNSKADNARDARNAHEQDVANKIINSYENSHVVDDQDGHEYMVQIGFDGFGVNRGYHFTPIFNGKAAQINKDWIKDHK